MVASVCRSFRYRHLRLVLVSLGCSVLIVSFLSQGDGQHEEEGAKTFADYKAKRTLSADVSDGEKAPKTFGFTALPVQDKIATVTHPAPPVVPKDTTPRPPPPDVVDKQQQKTQPKQQPQQEPAKNLQAEELVKKTAEKVAAVPHQKVVSHGSCAPTKHIMFLKTHKCASSSIQNMFLRFGYMNDLLFVMAAKGHYLGNPKPFHSSMVVPENRPPNRGKLDIFAMHSRLDVPEMSKILHSDSVYVTVVRDPPLLFESLYNYFDLTTFHEKTLDEFLDMPLENQMSVKRFKGRLGYNMMLWDMGVDVSPDMTVVEVRRIVEAADQLFDVVMVAEYLDESLILLKEKFCWGYEDIVFFTKNARTEDHVAKLSDDNLEKLQILNSGDMMLYEHFLKKHQAAVHKYGADKMAKEIKNLESHRQKLFAECHVKVVDKFNPESVFKEFSDQVNGYVVDPGASDDCLLLTLPELSLVEKIREKNVKLLQKSRIEFNANNNNQ